MINKKLLAGLWIVGLLCLAEQVYFWGGVAHSPSVGQLARDNAKFGSLLQASYLWAGDQALGLVGQGQRAAIAAEPHLRSAVESVRQNPAGAADTLLAAMPLSKTPSYYLAPLLLLLATYFQLRQPTQLHTIRRR